jgi:serine/threonine-protein kinase
VREEQPTVISHRAPMSLPLLLDTATPAGRLLPGMRVAHFELLEYVGGGGMGRVFRGLDTALARPVAIKVLSRQQADDPETLARFRNEAQSAARLSHKNIVRVYHIGEEEGLPYIVFEFIEGENLRTIVQRRGGLPLAEAIDYAFQVAEALDHAAANSVVHRDIKPSNVLVTRDGQAKLIDMGLARLQKLGDSDPDLTASGVTLGTFDYISPEQARDPRTADVRSDIYSLGCTLFYMLAGQPPFPAGTVLQKLLQHQGEEPPDIQEFRPDLPGPVSRLVRRMMAKDPRRRFQTPAELLDALVLLADEIGLGPIPSAGRPWLKPRRSRLSVLQRHVPWAAPAVVLAVLVLLLDALVWSPANAPWDPTLARAPVGGPESPPALDAKPAQPSEGAGAKSAAESAGKPNSSTSVKAGAGATGSQPGEKSLPPGATSAGPSGPGPSGPTGSSNLPKPAGAEPVGAEGGSKRPPMAVLQPEPLRGGISVGDPSWSGQLAVSQVEPAHAGLDTTFPSPAGEAKPSRTPTEPAAKPPGAGVLVVDGVGRDEVSFATLEQACAASANVDVIELRFNGPREVRPLQLNNRRLTIRVPAQFQPVLVFRPPKVAGAMIGLNGSQLTLLGVAIELGIPRERQAESWSLFELRRSKSLRLDRCALSIRNAGENQRAYHEDVAFFRIKAPPGGAIGEDDEAAPPEGTSITLADCVVRGEATVLRVHDLRPFQLTWNNGLLITTERLLRVDGGRRALPPAEKAKIDLEHLTAVVRAGLCRFEQNSTDPRQIYARIACADSILVGSAAGALIEQSGIAPSDRARDRVDFSGQRNFYQNFASFWTVYSNQPEQPPESWDADAWLLHWAGTGGESFPNFNRVQWKQPPPDDRPVHAHVPGDYALSDAAGADNPALGAASDSSDAGCQLGRLPPVPALAPWPGAPSPPSKTSPSEAADLPGAKTNP